MKKEQTDQFFNCPRKCVRLDFDQAIDFEFHCPECGELIAQDQDTNRINQIQKRIDFLEKEVEGEEKKLAKERKKNIPPPEEEPEKKVVKKKVAKKKVVKKNKVKKKV